MRMYDLIEKKKRGHALDKAEICWMIQSYTAGQIPDYQMAAFLMAVCFQGMDLQETTEMTLAMAHSGQMADLSDIAGVKVDKHSTGGGRQDHLDCSSDGCCLRDSDCQDVRQRAGLHRRHGG